MQRLLSLYSRLLATFFMFLGLLWTVNAQELEFESFDDELGGRQSSVYHIHGVGLLKGLIGTQHS